jgi:hypothetical protein
MPSAVPTGACRTTGDRPVAPTLRDAEKTGAYQSGGADAAALRLPIDDSRPEKALTSPPDNCIIGLTQYPRMRSDRRQE